MCHQSRFRSERGAVVIHVAIALIALLAFSAFVIDQGLMYVSRRQAQNAADAGALAGALAMVFDGGSPAVVTAAAHLWAANNVVWGEANSPANVDVTLSGPGSSIPPCGANPGCVRVDVMRNMPDRQNTIRGNPLPVYFSHLVGLRSQGVRATATAETAEGNAIVCLLPFAVIDRWADNFDENKDISYYPNDAQPGTLGWSPNDNYQPESLGFGPPADVYVGPYKDETRPTTGWTVEGDYGRQLVVKAGDIGDYSTGWAQRVDLPNSTGANDYNWNILNCNETPVGIADLDEDCPPEPGGDTTGREIDGCVSVSTGMAQGPTVQNGINVLVSRDPSAHWSASAPSPIPGLQGAVVNGSGVQDMASPRIRPIVVFDIDHYIASGCPGTNCIGKVSNIIGFFIEGTCGQAQSQGILDPGNWAQCENPSKDIVGRIVTIPGSFVAGVGDVDDESSFVKIVRLVR